MQTAIPLLLYHSIHVNYQPTKLSLATKKPIRNLCVRKCSNQTGKPLTLCRPFCIPLHFQGCSANTRAEIPQQQRRIENGTTKLSTFPQAHRLVYSTVCTILHERTTGLSGSCFPQVPQRSKLCNTPLECRQHSMTMLERRCSCSGS